jgi:hypothetical protein
MRPDWLQAATDAIRRNALPGRVAGLGAAIAIGTMEWFSLARTIRWSSALVVMPLAQGPGIVRVPVKTASL